MKSWVFFFFSFSLDGSPLWRPGKKFAVFFGSHNYIFLLLSDFVVFSHKKFSLVPHPAVDLAKKKSGFGSDSMNRTMMYGL